MKKKAGKAKATKRVKDLPAKTLNAKGARGVKGGLAGVHMKEATITYRKPRP